MTTARDAKEIIEKCIEPLHSVNVSLMDSLNHALTADIIADEPVPSFDNAAMDGYAVRYEDVVSVPVQLTVTGEIPAGVYPDRMLRQNEAMNIMTGAVIPQGCNAVIQQEWTERIDGNTVKILRSVNSGHNIRNAGADIEQGATVLKAGQLLRPQEIGVLASIGKTSVAVHRLPVVAVLTTGNEVSDIDVPLAKGKIRNSNAYVLKSFLTQGGCTVKDLGIARDDKDDLRKKISEGLTADILITSGGVSVGKYDLVQEVLREAGVDIKFWKVNIKPGMPLLFGMRGETAVFGLPGNPVSSMVTFLKFVKPGIMKMSGHLIPYNGIQLRAKLTEGISKTDGKRHFVRGIVTDDHGTYTVRTTGSQVSNVLSSLARANCLITLPEDQREFCAGDEVEIELL